MTSKSFTQKNKANNSVSLLSLVQNDLRQRIWLIVLSVITAFITLPIAYLYSGPSVQSILLNTTSEELTESFLSATSNYFYGSNYSLQIYVVYVSVFFIVGSGFSYLFFRPMTDLQHCIPVSRTKLFLSKYFSGFFIWFIPFTLGHLSTFLLAAFRIGDITVCPELFAIVFKELALLTLCFLILYNACLVPLMVSGHYLTCIFNILIYGLSIYLIYEILYTYILRYFETYYAFEPNYFPQFICCGLSPIATPLLLRRKYVWERSLGYTEFYKSLNFTISDNEWNVFIILAIAIMTLNFFLAIHLYKKRPSELAEQGVFNKTFRIFFRFITSVAAGLFIALSLASSATQNKFSWCFIGALIGCIVVFCFLNILYHSAIKAWRRHMLQLVTCAFVTCSIVSIFHFDLIGFDRYLPAKEEIQSMSLYCNSFIGNGYVLTSNEDGSFGYGTKSRFTDALSITDKDAIYNFLELMTDLENHPTQNHNYNTYNTKHDMFVKVNTKNGSYYRKYNCCWTEEVAEVLKPLASTEEYIRHYYPIGSGALAAPSEIVANSLDNSSVQIQDPELIQKIYQAYSTDFLEHYDVYDASWNIRLFTLDFLYPDGQTDKKHKITMSIAPWYSNTIQTLQEIYPSFCWSQDDFKYIALTSEIGSTHAGDEYHELQAWLLEETTGGALMYPDAPVTDKVWYGYITETDQLEALRPYIYLSSDGIHSLASKYTYIGKMDVMYTDAAGISTKSTLYCHIKRGEIPAWYIEGLRLQDE